MNEVTPNFGAGQNWTFQNGKWHLHPPTTSGGVTYVVPSPLEMTLNLIRAERWRQDQKWGDQDHPNGTGLQRYKDALKQAFADIDDAAAEDVVAWSHILLEEVYEALSTADDNRLLRELVQVAAVCVAWIENIQRRRQQ